MQPECIPTQLTFEALGGRQVVGRFDGGRLTTDGGVLLLREVDRRFRDHRSMARIEHRLETLVAQRVLGLAAGYEDLNDHDRLRADSALALASGCADVTGGQRRRARDRGQALAGSSTLNRLELSVPSEVAGHRYKKIAADPAAMDALLVALFLEAHPVPPGEIVLDLDATDDPLHGNQEGRFFHGYCRHYCYLPLYITCGDFVLCARLRTADIDAAEGRWRNCSGSWRRSAPPGRRRGSWCAAMPASAATTSWSGASRRVSTTSSASAPTPACSNGWRRRCASPGAGAWRPGRRRGGSGNGATGPARPEAGRAAWSARPSGCRGRAATTRASS